MLYKPPLLNTGGTVLSTYPGMGLDRYTRVEGWPHWKRDGALLENSGFIPLTITSIFGLEKRYLLRTNTSWSRSPSHYSGCLNPKRGKGNRKEGGDMYSYLFQGFILIQAFTISYPAINHSDLILESTLGGWGLG